MCKQLLIVLVLISSNFAVAQTSQPDSTEKLYAPYLRPEYHFSIEYNPGFTLWALSESKTTVISAGASWFPENKNIEIIMPIFIETTNKTQWFEWDYTGTALTVDLRYRKYILGKTGGLYISMGTSWHHLNLTKSDNYYDPYDSMPEHFKANRYGIGFGAGYRAFSDANINWTIGIFVGSYFIDDHKDNPLLGLAWMQSKEGGIIRVQLLKLGYAW